MNLRRATTRAVRISTISTAASLRDLASGLGWSGFSSYPKRMIFDTKSKVIMPLKDFSIGRLRLIDLVEDAAILKVLLLRLGPPPEQRIVDGHELDVRKASEIVGIDRLRV